MPLVGQPRYRLLGPVEVDSPDGRIVLAGSRQRLLLAALLLERGRTVSADRLGEMLWPDAQPAHPGDALRSQVARLRRSLGADGTVLRADASGYRLGIDPTDVDVHRFEALVEMSFRADAATAITALDEARQLWRGPVAVELCDCALTLPTVVRLDELRLAGRERRAEMLLELERADETVAELHELVTEHPERERARALLMEALSRTGRQVEALAQFRSWREDLARSGLEPSPDLQRLEGAILRHTLTPPPHDAPSRRTRVPRPMTSFLGRTDELAEVAGRVAATRFVTLTGAGGAGKTRLALAVVDTAVDGEDDAVAFVDLSLIEDPALVPASVAEAIGLFSGGGGDPDGALVAALADREVLLVVDNCEHVLDAAASLVGRLLAECPSLRVLATSREPLGVTGESIVRLAPLTAGDAAALFVERAIDSGAHLELARDWPLVEDICVHLDRLPLAIELAAKHADDLPLAALRDLLHDVIGLVRDDAVGPQAASRQRTMEATLRWSYDLLDVHEQRLLRHLAVFRGSFTAEMADCVAPTVGAHSTARRLGALHRKSLVTFDHRSGRYRLLETVREFAGARLVGHGEADAAHQRLYAWLHRNAPGPWRYSFCDDADDTVESELDNLRGALQWCRTAGRLDLAAVLAAQFGPMWFITIRGSEALGWLAIAPDDEDRLALDDRLAVRTAATYAAITAAHGAGIRAIDDHVRLTPPEHPAWRPLQFATAWMSVHGDRHDARRQLDAVRVAGDPGWAFNCDMVEGLTWLLDGEVERAIEVLRRCVARSAAPSDGLLNLAVACHVGGLDDDVTRIVNEVHLSRCVPSTWYFGDVVWALVRVLEAIGRHDLGDARRALDAVVDLIVRRYADVKLAAGFATVAAGIVALAAGRPDETVTILTATRRHRLHVRYEGGCALADVYEARARQAMTPPEIAVAVRGGEALTVDALLGMAHDLAGRRRQPSDRSTRR